MAVIKRSLNKQVYSVLETINGEGIAPQTSSLNQASNIELKGLTLESNTIHQV